MNGDDNRAMPTSGGCVAVVGILDAAMQKIEEALGHLSRFGDAHTLKAEFSVVFRELTEWRKQGDIREMISALQRERRAIELLELHVQEMAIQFRRKELNP